MTTPAARPHADAPGHVHAPAFGHSHGPRPGAIVTVPGAIRALASDRAVLLALALVGAVALFDAPALGTLLDRARQSFIGTLPFIVFAVLAVGYLKASGAENVIGRAFQGRELQMILFAAAFGGLSPFCSCEVIPFVAALLAVGAPLSAVMAFWLSSPLMDPPMFLITMGNLGLGFAIAKAVAAVGLGLFGGLGVMALSRMGRFRQPLRATGAGRTCGCGPANPFSQTPEWRFWHEGARRKVFAATTWDNALFLGKWLLLAYLIEAAMIAYVPADWIAHYLGGEGAGPIVLGAALGGPAYLNGYAAVPLVAGLLEQGMTPGAAMSFMLAGGVSCIPAALAVWALVRPGVFLSYLGFAFVGSVMAGGLWALIA